MSTRKYNLFENNSFGEMFDFWKECGNLEVYLILGEDYE